MKKYCPNCNKTFSGSYNFCPLCKKDLVEQEPVPLFQDLIFRRSKDTDLIFINKDYWR